MSLIVYVALIAAAVVALRHGPAKALLVVWLPAVLLIPDSFRAVTPGLPDPNFSQAAMVPIVAVALLRYAPRWRPTLVDALVVAFGVVVAIADYRSRGYADAQARRIFQDLVDMPAQVEVSGQEVRVEFHRRAHLPIVLASGLCNRSVLIPWWEGRRLRLTTYTGNAGTTSLTVGINNLTDQDPPLIYAGFLANSDASTYDYLGRYFYTRLTHNF